nr:RNA-directed DNA polymerase, eukaryota, reverse transcriptase zinc-binding domain protein [Tanacetum cinerariifolium]
MVDGVWKEQPNDVKKEFLNHFQERFDKPVERRVTIDMSYPRSILVEQRDELEREVTIEEIKMAVWNGHGESEDSALQVKVKMLSIGGRLTLLKSVLGSIPIFHMSIFRVPSKNNVLTDKKRGGLGVSSLYALTRGLMIKWLWKFFVHKDSIRTKVITAIHGVDGNVNSSEGKAGRSCWLAIMDEVRVLHKKGVYVFDFMNLILGNGEMVKLWLNRWFEGGILKDLFPRMFALENMKEGTVSSKLNGDNLADYFRRSPRGN